MSNFKICNRIDAHDNDVKSIYSSKSGNEFLTVSRDYSTRIWNSFDKSFIMIKKFIYHKAFISCVSYLINSEYNNGLILTGGYDKIINCYQPDSDKVEFVLNGHQGNVTSIAVRNCDVVSSSSDGTVINWNIEERKPKNIFKGHTQGIWKVIFIESTPNTLLTASADKIIIQWDFQTQNIINKYKGHTDCVRSIEEIFEKKQFISCGNDGSARLWDILSGSCLKVFFNCTLENPFLYDLCLIKNESFSNTLNSQSFRFVTCGEDGSVVIWDIQNNTKELQKFHVPNCNTVWCINSFINGDFAIGCSDGMVRIYTEDESRQDESLEVAEIKKTPGNLSQSLIDKYNKLPSQKIESISLPGSYDGEIMKILDDEEGSQWIYEWSEANKMWTRKIDLNAIKSADEPKSYVFSIDIKDGVPPLKLHYKEDQDPWVVAQKFLDDNDLTQGFLEEVANFIIKNTENSKENSIKPKSTVNQIEFSDPFTGASRYIPSYGETPNITTQPNTNSIIKKKRWFPVNQKKLLITINADGLLRKMDQFGFQIPDPFKKIIKELNNIESITSSDDIESTMKWVISALKDCPDDKLFPLLDVLRMLIVQDNGCNSICFTGENANLINDLLIRIFNPNSLASSHRGNAQNLLKLCINSFQFIPGQTFMINSHDILAFTFLSVAQDSNDPVVLNCVANWILNQTIVLNESERDPTLSSQDELRKKYKKNRDTLTQVCFQFLDRLEQLQLSQTISNIDDIITQGMITLGSLVCREDKFTVRDSITVSNFKKLGECGKKFRTHTECDLDKCCQDIIELADSIDIGGI